MNVTEIATLVGVCVAATGYFVNYRMDLKLEQRNDRLKRINQQLSEFYDPLLALTRSSGESREAFRMRHRPGDGSFWKADPPATRKDAIAWRLWMTTVKREDNISIVNFPGQEPADYAAAAFSRRKAV